MHWIMRAVGITSAMAVCLTIGRTAEASRPEPPKVGAAERTGGAGGAGEAGARLVRITHAGSGQTIRFDDRLGPAGQAPRGGVVVFDTMTNEDAVTGLNLAYVDPAAYTGGSGTYAFAVPLGERLAYRAPSDGGAGLPFPTDIVWNDYTSAASAWPGGATGGVQPLQSFAFVPYFQNSEPPLAARTHTLRVEFFSADRGTSYGGFEAEYRVSAGQTGYVGTTIDLSGLEPPVVAPRSGWVMLDWVEMNNSGVGCMFTGGDLVNPAYPRPESLWTLGTADPLAWWFADGMTGAGGPPARVNPGFDGHAEGVSYLDVLNTGACVDWAFTAGNPPVSFMAHDFACRLAVRGDGPPLCPCDVDGSGALNSQDFFVFIVTFFGGEADFNGSGETNSQDLFDFLVCFFGAC